MPHQEIHERACLNRIKTSAHLKYWSNMMEDESFHTRFYHSSVAIVQHYWYFWFICLVSKNTERMFIRHMHKKPRQFKAIRSAPNTNTQTQGSNQIRFQIRLGQFYRNGVFSCSAQPLIRLLTVHVTAPNHKGAILLMLITCKKKMHCVALISDAAVQE